VGREYEDIPDHDGRWTGETYIFHRRTPKARRRYLCDACDEPIEKGQRHVKYVTANVEGPGMETWRIHGECYLEGITMFGHDPRPAWRWQGDQ
jgi:hypothetical protein